MKRTRDADVQPGKYEEAAYKLLLSAREAVSSVSVGSSTLKIRDRTAALAALNNARDDLRSALSMHSCWQEKRAPTSSAQGADPGGASDPASASEAAAATGGAAPEAAEREAGGFIAEAAREAGFRGPADVWFSSEVFFSLSEVHRKLAAAGESPAANLETAAEMASACLRARDAHGAPADQVAAVAMHVALAYRSLAAMRSTARNFARAAAVLREAALKEGLGGDMRGSVLRNLGATHSMLAEFLRDGGKADDDAEPGGSSTNKEGQPEFDAARSARFAVNALTAALRDDATHIETYRILGKMHVMLAETHEPVANLKLACGAFGGEIQHTNSKSNPASYGLAHYNLACAHRKLAQRDVSPADNLLAAHSSLEKAISAFNAMKTEGNARRMQMLEMDATVLRELAKHHDPVTHLKAAVQAYTQVTLNLKDKTGLMKTHLSLGKTYVDLAGHEDPLVNLQHAIRMFKKAISLCKVAPTEYPVIATELGKAYSKLALHVSPESNLDLAVRVFGDAIKAIKTSTGPQFAAAQTKLGHAHYILSLMSSKTENLESAIQAYTAALTVYTRTQYQHKYSVVSRLLGTCLLGLAAETPRNETLSRALAALSDSLSVKHTEDKEGGYSEEPGIQFGDLEPVEFLGHCGPCCSIFRARNGPQSFTVKCVFPSNDDETEMPERVTSLNPILNEIAILTSQVPRDEHITHPSSISIVTPTPPWQELFPGNQTGEHVLCAIGPKCTSIKESFHEVWTTDRQVAWTLLTHWFVQLVCVVHRLERLNVVHRNINPNTVVIGDNGALKLTDFGYALVCTGDGTLQRELHSGTPKWGPDCSSSEEDPSSSTMPPEIAQIPPLDTGAINVSWVKADSYAAAKTIRLILSAEQDQEDQEQEATESEAPPLLATPPEATEMLGVVAMMLCEDPPARLSSFQALELLTASSSGSGSSTSSTNNAQTTENSNSS
ncbi:hypothetical protein Pelo_2080 [Pelomyxa schiedti]|nr:hypothetical protein Pelo_2080 [Pelomyxa schiedti]